MQHKVTITNAIRYGCGSFPFLGARICSFVWRLFVCEKACCHVWLGSDIILGHADRFWIDHCSQSSLLGGNPQRIPHKVLGEIATTITKCSSPEPPCLPTIGWFGDQYVPWHLFPPCTLPRMSAAEGTMHPRWSAAFLGLWCTMRVSEPGTCLALKGASSVFCPAPM